MTINRDQAKQICSADEMELVDASLPPAVERLDASALRSHVTRARKLQDKYRDLARRQHRGEKGAAAPGSRNVRTERKATLFVETRERFEERLGGLEGGS